MGNKHVQKTSEQEILLDWIVKASLHSLAVLSGAPLSTEVPSPHSFTAVITHLGLFAGWTKTATLRRLCKSYSLQCRDILGQAKAAMAAHHLWFHHSGRLARVEIITLGVGIGQKKEMGEGEGRKNISLFPTPPVPLMSHLTALTILEFSIVVTQTKTIAHQEKMHGMQARLKALRFESDGDVIWRVLKNLVMTTLKLYTQPANTNFNRNLSQNPANNFTLWIQNNWFTLIYK